MAHVAHVEAHCIAVEIGEWHLIDARTVLAVFEDGVGVCAGVLAHQPVVGLEAHLCPPALPKDLVGLIDHHERSLVAGPDWHSFIGLSAEVDQGRGTRERFFARDWCQDLSRFGMACHGAFPACEGACASGTYAIASTSISRSGKANPATRTAVPTGPGSSKNSSRTRVISSQNTRSISPVPSKR